LTVHNTYTSQAIKSVHIGSRERGRGRREQATAGRGIGRGEVKVN